MLCLGLLVCSCNTCTGSDSCIVNTREGGKCALDIDHELQGNVQMGCAKQSQLQCTHPIRCCSNKDYCNRQMLYDLVNGITTDPTSPDKPGKDKPHFEIGNLVENRLNLKDSVMTTAYVRSGEFDCHCSNCTSNSCRTNHYCVAAVSKHNTAYGCIDSSNEILTTLCQTKMPNIYCCKGNKCNKIERLLPTAGTNTRTIVEKVIDINTDSTQSHNCKLSKSDNASSDELKDSEYVVILVCITVPSFFIFLTLVFIFCYTVRKYHRQSTAKRTTISTQNGGSRVSNGNACIGDSDE